VFENKPSSVCDNGFGTSIMPVRFGVNTRDSSVGR
jgi:hypothetical protein